ncbi:MAG: S8 family serine peptidase [Verrucomicrobia bacterium]|nr:S8 family serine peptidase [Verrucomicrobiota bacterium]
MSFRLLAIFLSLHAFTTALNAQLLISGSSSHPDRVPFLSSFREVKTEPTGNYPLLVRKELTTTEYAETLRFSLALKMHNFTELKQRASSREIIPLKEIVAKYYPPIAEYNKVADWLRGQGFSVEPAGKHNLSVFASGPIWMVEKVFATQFARVTFLGEEHTSAIVAPSLPTEIADPVLGINGLQPHLHARRHQSWQSKRMPKLASNSFAQGYTVSNILSAYNASGLGTTGAGQTIAIVIDTFPDPNDLIAFWQINGVPQHLSNIQKTQVVSGPLPAPSGEETIDVEWSSSIAPEATIHVYAATDLYETDLDQAYQAIIDDLELNPTLGQMSLSYSLGESFIGPDQMLTDDMYFTVLAANGVSIFAGSGDGGARPDENGNVNNADPVQVVFPASDPNVISVGGTTLLLNPDGTVISEVAWSDGGGGISQFWSRPSWQNAPGAPVVGYRMVPDVALNADPSTGFYVQLNGQNEVFGGTSVATPIWAGISALINQSRTNLGLPKLYSFNQNLYPLAGTDCFRQITSGNNGYYSAGLGYNLCTGLGTPNVTALINALANSIPRGSIRLSPPIGNVLSFSGDFNNDGKQDILWRNTETGEVIIWFMDGPSVSSVSRVGYASLDWKIVATADFDNSGYSDILWENINDGSLVVWIMRGGAIANQIWHASPGFQYTITGVADIYHTGEANIIWRNINSGEVFVWQSVGAPFSFNSSGAVGVATLDWTLAGTADLFGDGNQELIWRNTNTGQVVAWRLAGFSIASQAPLGNPSLNWQIVATGNLNGSNTQGILWRNLIDGSIAAWSMQGFSVAGQWMSSPRSSYWQVKGLADVSGNHSSDILWSNIVTGEQVLWGLSNYGFYSIGSLGQTDPSWAIQP